ncbi:hypothetical protein VHEMI00368 [[Torrubiella] hemipterigena]|uniref:Extracellular membrane protein CFEM domain-containing protein n=1 Tax=[Torrubiella] hemipterigena TaxID=1531966 RepID=A0A0A1T273_9HYPO|nr:hypothetical protein VHEMI00368 [[Torrubiella] hemipterigena]
MRPTIASAATVLALASTAIAGNFDFYPKGSQTCLEAALNASKCPGSVSERNSCLCSDGGGFVTNTAKCLGKGKDTRALVPDVFTTMVGACDTSDTPLSVDQSTFQNTAADAAKKADDDDKKKTTTTSSAAKTTPTSTSTTNTKSSPTNKDSNDKDSNNKNSGNNDSGNKDSSNKDSSSNGDKKSGLSTGAIIGIAVGAGVVGLAAIAVLLAFLRRRRAMKAAEERDPMLHRSFGNEDGNAFGQSMHNEPMSSYDGASSVSAYNRASAYTQPTISPEPQYQQQYSPPPQQYNNGTPQFNQPQQFSPHHSFNAVPAAAAAGAAGAAGLAAGAVPAWYNHNQAVSPPQRYEPYAAPPLVSQSTTPGPPVGFAELAPDAAASPKPSAPVFEMDGGVAGASSGSQPPKLPELIHPPSLQPPGLQSQDRR